MINYERIEWRKRWLKSINELTSYKLQKKSWCDATLSNPHWTFFGIYVLLF